MKPHRIINLKVTFFLIFLIYLSLSTNILYAQYTAIPDPLFEQALIYLGIDSDGVINGQVLTSDIDTVITLEIPLEGIHDLTGIEDFTALEILDVSNNDLTILDVSNNIQLKELYVSNIGALNLAISSLDLSNNINLELLFSDNLFLLESVNLKNGNNPILTVRILCHYEGEDCELLDLNCVTVDNEEAAANGEPPYSNWLIDANYIYSEDCSLSVPSHKVKVFSVYPNPVQDQLIISSLKNNIERLRITIFTIEGKLILAQDLILNQQNTINVSNFSKGIYFISLQKENGQLEVIKFVKE